MIDDDSMDDELRNCASTWMFRIMWFYLIQQIKVERKISGFDIAKFNLLRILDGSGNHSMSHLGKILYQSKPYMSNLVDSLIQDKMVTRIPDQNDRRVINICITNKGIEFLESKKLEAIKDMKSLMENLPTQDIQELCETSQKYYHMLTKMESSELMITLGNRGIDMKEM